MADPKKKPAPAPTSTDPLAGLNVGSPSLIPAGNARQPLGPPAAFYQEQAQARPELAGFEPYQQGDQFVPGYNLNTEDRDRLKYRMNQAGLYGTSGYQSGSWTPEDANAYEIVLTSANAMGQRDPEVVIDNIANEVKKGPRVQGPRAPLVSHVSNPDDIRAVLRDTSFSLTGTRLSAEDENRLISLFQGQQHAADQSAYAAGGTAGPGGTVTDPASMQNFAEAQIERLKPGEVGVHQHLAAFEKIMQSMGTLVATTPEYKGEGLPTTSGAEVL